MSNPNQPSQNQDSKKQSSQSDLNNPARSGKEESKQPQARPSDSDKKSNPSGNRF